jgi:hypothetical protein
MYFYKIQRKSTIFVYHKFSYMIIFEITHNAEDQAARREHLAAEASYIQMINDWTPNLGWKQMWLYFSSWLRCLQIFSPIPTKFTNKVIAAHLLNVQELNPNPLEQYDAQKFITLFMKYKVSTDRDTVFLLWTLSCKLHNAVNLSASATLEFIRTSVEKYMLVDLALTLMQVCAMESNSSAALILFTEVNSRRIRPSGPLLFHFVEAFVRSNNMDGAIGLLEHIYERNLLTEIPKEFFETMAKSSLYTSNPDACILVLDAMKSFVERKFSQPPTSLMYEYCISALLTTLPPNLHDDDLNVMTSIINLHEEMLSANYTIHSTDVFSKLLVALTTSSSSDHTALLFKYIRHYYAKRSNNNQVQSNPLASIQPINAVLNVILQRQKEHRIKLSQICELVDELQIEPDVTYYTFLIKLMVRAKNPAKYDTAFKFFFIGRSYSLSTVTFS